MDVFIEKGWKTGLLSCIFAFTRVISPSPLSEKIFVIEKDLRKNGIQTKISLDKRFQAYKNGFTTHKYLFYDLSNYSQIDDYLSDFHTSLIRRNIHKNTHILYNKKKFHDFMIEKGLTKYAPKFLGVIKNGEFDDGISILDIMDKYKKVVVKPIKGSQGAKLSLLEKKKDSFKINNKKKNKEELKSYISNLDDFIVTEFCEQANFLKYIYPNSTNTVRILTIYPKNDDPIIIHAYLRIGTKRSGFVDNVHRGGLTANINLDTGELGTAARILPDGRLKWYDFHPDTNRKIKGVQIPAWNEFKSKFISINRKINEFKIVGWDLLFIDKGDFVFIEGNNKYVGYRGHQIHTPLLKSKPLRNFLVQNGLNMG